MAILKVLLTLLSCSVVEIKTSILSSSSIICEYYNSTCLKEAFVNKDIKPETCYGNQTCGRALNTCYTVWTNSTSQYETEEAEEFAKFKHPSGLTVKMMGCFQDSPETCHSVDQCIESSKWNRADHLFCCCKNNMCNSNFKWIPPPKGIDSSNETSNSSTGNMTVSLKVMIFMGVSVVAGSACSAIGIVYWIKKRANSNRGMLPNSDEDGNLINKEEMSSDSKSHQRRDIELVDIKARGRFGAVWKGKYGREMVAVKIFPFQDKNSWAAEQEIYNLPQMDHENILKFVGVERRGENLEMEYWLITSFHEKGSLCDFLKFNVLTWNDLCKIAYTMARGLDHLHEQAPATGNRDLKPSVAHRDFKSKNVLIKSDMTACIADFGLAIIFEPNKTVGETHGQVGTRRYMAPEVLEGAINFSRNAFLRIDMYACGLVLWELASRCSFSIANGNNNPVLSNVDDYKLPFEAESVNPTLEQMQTLVVKQRCRPKVKEAWRSHPGMNAFVTTLEDCWDHDAEARISSSCVVERLKNIQHMDLMNNRANTRTSEEEMNAFNQIGNSLSTEFAAETTEMTPLYIQPPGPGSENTVRV